MGIELWFAFVGGLLIGCFSMMWVAKKGMKVETVIDAALSVACSVLWCSYNHRTAFYAAKAVIQSFLGNTLSSSHLSDIIEKQIPNLSDMMFKREGEKDFCPVRERGEYKAILNRCVREYLNVNE